MGLRSTWQACQRTTNGVTFAFAKQCFKLVNYIDDLAGAETDNRAEEAFSALSELLDRLGLQESIAKACPPSMGISFWGIQFDTVSGMLTVPHDKLAEAKVLLSTWSAKSHATKQEVQSLVSSLNFLAACIRPG